MKVLVIDLDFKKARNYCKPDSLAFIEISEEKQTQKEMARTRIECII